MAREGSDRLSQNFSEDLSRGVSDDLSDDDAHLLDVESTKIFGHTLKLVVLQPAEDSLSIDALRASVARRLPAQPRTLQRVDTSGPHPRWVAAPDFDIANHVRQRANAECVSREDMWRVVSGLMSEHLDRSRPLWTFDVIGPFADGREAIAARIHHAMCDGIAAVRLLETVLLDTHPDPPARSGAQPGIRPASRRGRLTKALQMPGAVARELGNRASGSPFDVPITGARELAFAFAPLAELMAIGHSRPTHATVNDVLLTIVAGGLREWLETRGAATQRLRAQIPVSLHQRDEKASDPGNRDSFLNVDLPLGVGDPLARLDIVSAETRTRKSHGDAQELYDLFHALGRVHRIGNSARRFAGTAREFSVAVSNVPGPPTAVGVAGRRVLHLFSSSEPALHHALRISAISCAGDIGIGLCVDPQAVPDVSGLAAAIENSYSELRNAAIRM
jgi:WS/DGAT/MGAT family acyltransferase